MPMLLQIVAQNLSAWNLGQPKPGKMITTYPLKYEGGTPAIQLLPSSEAGSVWTPFEPRAFNGTGEEERKGIVFSIPEPIREQMELLEERVREQLKPTFARIDSMWNSSTKPAGKYPSQLKCKIRVSGPRACRCVDSQGASAQFPQDWSNLCCIPIFLLTAYVQKASAGLIIDVVALKLFDKREPGCCLEEDQLAFL